MQGNGKGYGGVTERTVTTFCKTGKIPGAVKEGKSWRIPDEAEKPVDGRVLSGKYVKKEEKEARKPLPIGISDYVRHSRNIIMWTRQE